MKVKLFILAMLIFPTLQAQKIKSAGKWMGEGEFLNKPILLGDDDAMETVLKAIEAYNAGNSELELSYYSDEYKKKNGAFTKEWHETTTKLNMKPWVMFPIRIKGDDRTQVLSWSVEEREWKNGSKQKQNLMEIFVVNKSGEISGFNQWRRNYPDNEFGLATGGKFFGKTKSEYTGRKLVFSNRGETEIIEKFIKAYNKKDSKTCKTFFIDGAIVEGSDGSSTAFTHEMWNSYFDSYSEILWNPYDIVPLKIYNTDPASGVSVQGRETRTLKNGNVWDKEIVDYFYFNLDGKINRVVQYERSLNK